jgi:hypothetical protein
MRGRKTLLIDLDRRPTAASRSSITRVIDAAPSTRSRTRPVSRRRHPAGDDRRDPVRATGPHRSREARARLVGELDCALHVKDKIDRLGREFAMS